jgi:two-component system, OmpR family, sensor histidine kinase KdpD
MRAAGNTSTPSRAARRASIVAGLIACAATVAIETAVCWFLLGGHLQDIVMLYLLGVVVMAMRFGYVPSLVTAALSVVSVDFFFTVPYFSLAVTDKRYLMTFVIMLFVAFVISSLTERIRRDAASAFEGEVRTAKLYAMSRGLSSSGSSQEIVEVALRHLREAFGASVAVLLAGEGGQLRVAAPLKERTLEVDVGVQARAGELFARSAMAPPVSCVLSTGERIVPLSIGSVSLGMLVIRPPEPDPFVTHTNRDLLDAYANQIALAIERSRLADAAQSVQLEVQRERLRNALLSSVSHDLRTPLAVVKGAITALLDQEDDLPPGRRHEYLETISDEASRLNRLVRNLLNMTSLEAGALRARKEWQPLEEVVGVALNRLEEPLSGRPVYVRIAPEASLVPIDASLIEQVLVNLIENAIKYTRPGSPIEIGARLTSEGVHVEIADRGPGIPTGQETMIFEKFHRALQSGGVAGMGLGLAICRGMVLVHGGRIWCENRDGGGASFHLVLPRSEAAPALRILPEMAES